MAGDLLYPFWVSFATFGVIFLLIPFISETSQPLQEGNYEAITDASSSSIEGPEESYIPESPLHEHESTDEVLNHATLLGEAASTTPGWATLWKRDWNLNKTKAKEDIMGKVRELWMLFNGPTARFCLTAFFSKRIAFMSEGFMFQYASEKFGWKLRETTWLRVTSSAGAVFVTLIMCPTITWFFAKRGSASSVVDLNVIRGALFILVISFLGSWISWSGLVLAVGK